MEEVEELDSIINFLNDKEFQSNVALTTQN
jgi:hypothetical protein